MGSLGRYKSKVCIKIGSGSSPALSAGSPALVHIISGVFGMHIFVSCFWSAAASSFIRDLGTRTFIILDVIWTCQFLPQWPLSLSILKLNICWAKSTDKLALHPADYLAVENGCLKIEIRVLKLLNGLKAIYEQNLRPPLKDQAQYV